MLFPMPVIVSAHRSGTTLLRLMLDAHPGLAIPPETGFLALCTKWLKSPETSPENFIDTISDFPLDTPTGIRTFYRAYSNRFNKSRYGDKTPNYCFHIAAIHQLLPETCFIHLIRDGRDVALSWRHEMSSDKLREFEANAGEWLNKLGYLQ
jgi:hypothetical protein